MRSGGGGTVGAVVAAAPRGRPPGPPVARWWAPDRARAAPRARRRAADPRRAPPRQPLRARPQTGRPRPRRGPSTAPSVAGPLPAILAASPRARRAGVKRVEAAQHAVVDLDGALVVAYRDALVDAVEARRVGRPDGEAGEAGDVVGEGHEPARVAGAGGQPTRHRPVALSPPLLRCARTHVPSRRARA